MWIDAAGQGKSAGAVQTRIFIAGTGASAARKTLSSLGRFTGDPPEAAGSAQLLRREPARGLRVLEHAQDLAHA